MAAGRSVAQPSPGWVHRLRDTLGPVGNTATGQGQGWGRPHEKALVNGTLAQESKRQRSPDAPKMLFCNEPTAHTPAAHVLGGFSSGRGLRLRHWDPRAPAPSLWPELGLSGASRRKAFGQPWDTARGWPSTECHHPGLALGQE